MKDKESLSLYIEVDVPLPEKTYSIPGALIHPEVIATFEKYKCSYEEVYVDSNDTLYAYVTFGLYISIRYVNL
jgi:hypothetical protein